MRVHCIDFYDSESHYIGGVWISSARGDGRLHIDLQELNVDGLLELNPSQVAVFRDACDAFLKDVRRIESA
jgi:hypothetical protein